GGGSQAPIPRLGTALGVAQSPPAEECPFSLGWRSCHSPPDAGLEGEVSGTRSDQRRGPSCRGPRCRGRRHSPPVSVCWSSASKPTDGGRAARGRQRSAVPPQHGWRTTAQASMFPRLCGSGPGSGCEWAPTKPPTTAASVRRPGGGGEKREAAENAARYRTAGRAPAGGPMERGARASGKCSPTGVARVPASPRQLPSHVAESKSRKTLGS
ncbi:Hypothetical predicted protein, partial [Marmota monax]